MGGRADGRWAALCLFWIRCAEPWKRVHEGVCGWCQPDGDLHRAPRISGVAICCAATGYFQIRGRARVAWADFRAEEFEGWREAAGGDLFAWRADAADVAGLALHVLLL